MSKSTTNTNRQLVSLTPDTLVDLYEIDFSNLQPNFEELNDLYGINIGADTTYRFCPMINGTNPVVWQGKSYQPLPIKMEGFEQKSDGRLPRPTFSLANPDGLFSKIIHSNQDFANCKITRKRTYARFLDAENFPGGENPFGDPDPNSHLIDDVYFVNRKQEENKQFVQFELVSALELEDSFVPARVVLAGYCNFTYRCSVGCGYKGLPIETSGGQSLVQGFATNKQKNSSGVYDAGLVNAAIYGGRINNVDHWNKYGPNKNSENISGYNLGDVVKIVPRNSGNPYKATPHVFVCVQSHADPSKHHPFFDKEHWLKDECSKTIEGCKKRFSSKVDKETGIDLSRHNESLNSKGLRFGGFPGTEKFPIE
jgi:lambda family phage minor tail protein L